jgi:hypothetical protein
MKKPRKQKPKLEDTEQSRRFIEAARAVEAAGGLSAVEATNEMERAFVRVTRHPKKDC